MVYSFSAWDTVVRELAATLEALEAVSRAAETPAETAKRHAHIAQLRIVLSDLRAEWSTNNGE